METNEIINSFEMSSDKEFALSVVSKQGLFIKNLSQDLRNDRDVVITAVNQNPLAIIFCDPMYNDDEYVMNIVREKMPDAIFFKAKEKELVKEEIFTPILADIIDEETQEETIEEINFILVGTPVIIKEERKPRVLKTKLITTSGVIFEDEDFIMEEEKEDIEDDDIIEEDFDCNIVLSQEDSDTINNFLESDIKPSKEQLTSISEIATKIKNKVEEMNSVTLNNDINEKDKKLEVSYEEAISLVKENGLNLAVLSDEYKNDLLIVANAVLNNKEAIRLANKSMQINDDILLLLEVDITDQEKEDYIKYLEEKVAKEDDKKEQRNKRVEVIKGIFEEANQSREEEKTSIGLFEQAKNYINSKIRK